MWPSAEGSWRDIERSQVRVPVSVVINLCLFTLGGGVRGERRGKRKRSTIFLEMTREGHRQSDEHWNCFRGSVGKIEERRGGAHMGFSERIDIILN